MKLIRFQVRNYKGIEHAELLWDDILVLIGDNNCGKSSVLQALALFLSGSAVRDELLFRNKCTDESNAIELIGEFTALSEKEKENKAVQGRMDGDKWILKKKFWCEADGEGGEEKWKEMYYSFSPKESFADWPESTASWNAFNEAYKPLLENIPGGKGTKPNREKLDALREIVKQEKPELVQLSAADWVQNPGGGGNWKSNANSILPKHVWVKAVHEAADSLDSKDKTAYGQLIGLIIEKKLMQRAELAKLKDELQKTLDLIGMDEADPTKQAQEIRDVQNQINQRLDAVISGIVSIHIDPLQIPEVILPSTYLLVRDHKDAIATRAEHQGHGLQRSLIMALLQVLADEQRQDEQAGDANQQARSVILAIDEPELYMHPQMERKMRDALYALASSQRFQVICTTHSPVFLDVGAKHRSIVRIVKDPQRKVTVSQVTEELFNANDPAQEKEQLKVLSNFHPTINEVFLAKRVVLLEEESAEWAIRRAAELTGIFARHPQLRRDVTIIDCGGKGNIPAFQRVLNHFGIAYAVVHDEDRTNPQMAASNATIAGLAQAPNRVKMVSPECIEQCLGYQPPRKDKPYQALRFIEQLHAQNQIPAAFTEIVNEVYFGAAVEPILGHAKD
ncbi:MAG: ATP-dependent endonuclease [Phycisphaerales bacterium]|nr:ATP-dependent endonuclease [Phycisphaerales bacterium]